VPLILRYVGEKKMLPVGFEAPASMQDALRDQLSMAHSREALHRHWAGFKTAASALGYGSKVVPAAGFAPALAPF
jgi:hypothetical protein